MDSTQLLFVELPLNILLLDSAVISMTYNKSSLATLICLQVYLNVECLSLFICLKKIRDYGRISFSVIAPISSTHPLSSQTPTSKGAFCEQQKTVVLLRKFQEFQKLCAKNWGQRPNMSIIQEYYAVFSPYRHDNCK